MLRDLLSPTKLHAPHPNYSQQSTGDSRKSVANQEKYLSPSKLGPAGSAPTDLEKGKPVQLTLVESQQKASHKNVNVVHFKSDISFSRALKITFYLVCLQVQGLYFDLALNLIKLESQGCCFRNVKRTTLALIPSSPTLVRSVTAADSPNPIHGQICCLQSSFTHKKNYFGSWDSSFDLI